MVYEIYVCILGTSLWSVFAHCILNSVVERGLARRCVCGDLKKGATGHA